MLFQLPLPTPLAALPHITAVRPESLPSPKFAKARQLSFQNPPSSPRAISYLDEFIEIIHMATCQSSQIEFRKGSLEDFMIGKKLLDSSA
jgi:hypothetical protein